MNTIYRDGKMTMREKKPRITSAVALGAMRVAVVFEDSWQIRNYYR